MKHLVRTKLALIGGEICLADIVLFFFLERWTSKVLIWFGIFLAVILAVFVNLMFWSMARSAGWAERRMEEILADKRNNDKKELRNEAIKTNQRIKEETKNEQFRSYRN